MRCTLGEEATCVDVATVSQTEDGGGGRVTRMYSVPRPLEGLRHSGDRTGRHAEHPPSGISHVLPSTSKVTRGGGTYFADA